MTPEFSRAWSVTVNHTAEGKSWHIGRAGQWVGYLIERESRPRIGLKHANRCISFDL